MGSSATAAPSGQAASWLICLRLAHARQYRTLSLISQISVGLSLQALSADRHFFQRDNWASSASRAALSSKNAGFWIAACTMTISYAVKIVIPCSVVKYIIPRGSTLEALQDALEAAGVLFLDHGAISSDGSHGVRLLRRQ